MIKELTRILVRNYGFDKVKLIPYREMIGSLFIAEVDETQYMVKVYKEVFQKEAINSVQVMSYLGCNGAPVPQIIYTLDENTHCLYDEHVVVVFEYIFGDDVCLDHNEEGILKSLYKIQDIMKKYGEELPQRSFEFYVSRYLEVLMKKNYDKKRVREMEIIGNFFYSIIDEEDKKFVHGDLHTGNMISMNNKIVIYDFDTAALFNPLIDSMTLFDRSNFNYFKEEDIVLTYKTLLEKGTFTKQEVEKMMAFIPLRHYELIATIISVKGDEHISESFYDQQYYWIKDFYDYYQNYIYQTSK